MGSGNAGGVEVEASVTDEDDVVSGENAGDGEQSSSDGGETHFDGRKGNNRR